MDSKIETAGKNRLIVLLPGSLAGDSSLAQKIYWLAVQEQRNILYLVLFDDIGEYSLIARDMATMAALTSSSMALVNSKLVSTQEWYEALREIYRPGDVLVCQAEQTVKAGFFKTIPVCEFLETTFNPPIRTMSGYYQPWQVQTSRWLRNLLVWAGFLAVIILFGLLEIQIDQGAQGVARTVLFLLALGFEFGAIWLLNYLT